MNSEAFNLLRKALEDAFPTLSDLQILVRVVKLEWHQTSVNPYKIFTDATKLDIAVADTIVYFQSRNGLEALVKAARIENPDNLLLTNFELQVLPNLSQQDSCFATFFLRNNYRRPIIDRHKLRKMLEDLYTVMGARTLIIRGDEKSGKSYSFQLISYLADELPRKFIPIKIDFLNDTSDIQEILTSRVAARMGINPAELPSQKLPAKNLERKIDFLTDWIFNRMAAQKDTFWWLIFDHCNQSYDPLRASELINWLVDKIEGDEFKNVRLVLIDYDERPPLGQPIADALRDEITMLDDYQHLTELLRWTLRRNDLEAPIEVVEAKKRIVLERAENLMAANFSRMEALNRAVEQVIREHLEEEAVA